MKKLLRNISFIGVLMVMVASCTEAEPDYTTFPSKDVDFIYAVAPNSNGELEYALDYYVVSTIQFTNTSAKEGSVTWDFGDGTTSNEENPQHKYAKAGIYQVKLTIEGVGSRTYPLMIYDIAPVLSVKEQLTTAGEPAEIITINDVAVSFDIFLPNPENKEVKYEWTFPDGTTTENGEPLTSFEGNDPGKVRFKNIGSQRVTLRATFDVGEGGENRQLEEAYMNVQVGADKEYKTLYYAALDGNIKALKVIPDEELPEGTKNLPFDLGVSSGSMPFNLVYADVVDGSTTIGWIYILDAGRQYYYINDENGVNGDGQIRVMGVDGTGTNVMVTNVGQAAFDDPFYGCVDGTNLLYSDRNNGLRQLPLTTRAAKEANNYFVINTELGYYSRGLAYGAINTTVYKDSKDTYWWGKCYNGEGIFRFKASDKIADYTTATRPNEIVLAGTKIKGFVIDEERKSLYVWRWMEDSGFYVYNLPDDQVAVGKQEYVDRILMDADPLNTTASEGVFVTQMAVDKETGFVYFGFNKEAKDGTAYQTGLKRYNPANKGKLDNISEVADKILGITINDHKSKLF